MRKRILGVAITAALALSAVGGPVLAGVDPDMQALVIDNGSGLASGEICHKPGTAAEKTLVFADLPEQARALEAPLEHGDTPGACTQPAPGGGSQEDEYAEEDY